MVASKCSFENIFNINDLRAILLRVSSFVLTSFAGLHFNNRGCFYGAYHKIGIDLCKVLLKTVQS